MLHNSHTTAPYNRIIFLMLQQHSYKGRLWKGLENTVTDVPIAGTGKDIVPKARTIMGIDGDNSILDT